MRKPRIQIRVLCVLQKAKRGIQFVFYSYVPLNIFSIFFYDKFEPLYFLRKKVVIS